MTSSGGWLYLENAKTKMQVRTTPWSNYSLLQQTKTMNLLRLLDELDEATGDINGFSNIIVSEPGTISRRQRSDSY